MDIVEFQTICSANGISFTKEQNLAIKRYHDELIYWNEKVNMVSRKDTERLLEYHILHSVIALKYVDVPQKSRCLDVGTGGGLPGIPLTIVRPDLKMLLVDSIAKKLKTTAMMAAHTGCRHLVALCARAETLAEDKANRGAFDFIFTRSVARMKPILEWVAPLTHNKSQIVFYKGGDLADEIHEARLAFPGLRFTEHPIVAYGADWFQREDKKIVVGELID